LGHGHRIIDLMISTFPPIRPATAPRQRRASVEHGGGEVTMPIYSIDADCGKGNVWVRRMGECRSCRGAAGKRLGGWCRGSPTRTMKRGWAAGRRRGFGGCGRTAKSVARFAKRMGQEMGEDAGQGLIRRWRRWAGRRQAGEETPGSWAHRPESAATSLNVIGCGLPGESKGQLKLARLVGRVLEADDPGGAVRLRHSRNSAH
jgi:hypothetical protein